MGLVLSVAGLAACSDTSVKTVNSGPEAIIASHSTGDTVLEGDTETVIGQVGDTDHALDELSVTWLQDGEAVCTDSAPDSTGNVLCPMTFAVGGGEISLMVRDPSIGGCCGLTWGQPPYHLHYLTCRGSYDAKHAKVICVYTLLRK